MLADVIKRAPIEACGIVAGRRGQSEKIYKITNILNSPNKYRMAPEEQLEAFNEIEQMSLIMLAIYHSHPEGPDSPSQTDISEFYYPGIYSLIWSQKKRDWVCRGYKIEHSEVSEIQILILENE